MYNLRFALVGAVRWILVTQDRNSRRHVVLQLLYPSPRHPPTYVIRRRLQQARLQRLLRQYVYACTSKASEL